MADTPLFKSACQTGQGYADVDPEEVFQKMKQITLIDVRQREELVSDLGHIKGMKWMLLDELPETLLSLKKNETYVFICRSGGRSGRAAGFAAHMGFTDVYNMTGGMIAWNELGFEVSREME